jgi:hypothetical protein
MNETTAPDLSFTHAPEPSETICNDCRDREAYMSYITTAAFVLYAQNREDLPHEEAMAFVAGLCAAVEMLDSED